MTGDLALFALVVCFVAGMFFTATTRGDRSIFFGLLTAVLLGALVWKATL